MRKINKDFGNIPKALISKTCTGRVDSIVQQQKYNGNSDYYAHSDVRKELERYYNNKCGFCETDPTAGAYLEVEHYRPKSEVKNETHLGYYWLAHEWSNLLYACRRCNGGKSSHFPIKSTGIRILKHPMLPNGNLDVSKCVITDSGLQKEEALLLHPEIDDPNEHLVFFSNGEIKGLTDRGEQTILICQLGRTTLQLARKKMIEDTMFSLMQDISAFKEGEIDKNALKYNIKKELLKIVNIYTENKAYSILALMMFKQFDVFFINRFELGDRVHFYDVYNGIKNQLHTL